MKKELKRLFSLLLGLSLFALGIVLTLKANIGYSPWDVLHSGLSEMVGLTFGTVSILVGLLICLFVVAMGEKLGVGTVLNMILIGALIDLLMSLDLIPTMQNVLPGILTLIVGLFVISFGSYFYIRAGYGAGPRDYLMMVIRRKTHLPVGLSRGLVEGSVLVLGWVLGGPVGFGTALSAFGISISIQIVFSLMRFEAVTVHHEDAAETATRYLQGLKPR